MTTETVKTEVEQLDNVETCNAEEEQQDCQIVANNPVTNNTPTEKPVQITPNVIILKHREKQERAFTVEGSRKPHAGIEVEQLHKKSTEE